MSTCDEMRSHDVRFDNAEAAALASASRNRRGAVTTTTSLGPTATVLKPPGRRRSAPVCSWRKYLSALC
jgi:hypothetical protein